MLIMCWSSTEESVDIQEMILINSYGWCVLEVESILILRRKIMLENTDIELTIWFFHQWKIVWCTDWVIIVHGKLILLMENLKVTIMFVMSILAIKISNSIISLKLLQVSVGLFVFTSVMKELIVRQLNWLKKEIISVTLNKKVFLNNWFLAITTAVKLDVDSL